jgi:hypothetical protein
MAKMGLLQLITKASSNIARILTLANQIMCGLVPAFQYLEPQIVVLRSILYGTSR